MCEVISVGYYTQFKLYIDKFDNTLPEFFDNLIAELEEISNYGFSYEGNYCIESVDDCKWYDHEGDMIALSKLHPEITFTLCGVGEEHYWKNRDTVVADIWKKEFKNGEMKNLPIELDIEQRK